MKHPGNADPTAERAPATWIERNRVRSAPIRRRYKVSAAGDASNGRIDFPITHWKKESVMGGCAKNGKDGKDGKDDSAVALSLALLGISRKHLTSLKIAPSKKYISVRLADCRPVAKSYRAASNKYWRGLMKQGIADTVVTATNDTTTVVLVVNSKTQAKKIIEADPFIAAGGFTKFTYKELKV